MLVILGIVVLAGALCFFTLSSIKADRVSSLAGHWEVVLELKPIQPVRMAAFLNDQFGVTGGYSKPGKANVTRDGGKTWTLNEDSGGCLYGIEAVDSNIIWLCGRMKGVSFSTPGGLRLSTDSVSTIGPSSNITTTPAECPMSFLDDKRGLFSQEKNLSETLDGGLTWREIRTPPDIGKIKGVGYYSDNSGYMGFVLEEAGRLFKTSDGGTTWEEQDLGLEEKYAGMKVASMEGASASIRFFDRMNGMAVISLIGNQQASIVAFRTADGGKTWSDGLVAAGAGSIYLTHDGAYVTSTYNGKITVYHFVREQE